MTGRPSKLTAENAQRIADLVRVGNYLETAAAAANVHRVTLHRWLRRGQEEESGLYREFLESVEKAQAEAESRDVALIAKAARDGNWQAAAWRLERRFPRKYGQRVQFLVQEELQRALQRLEAGLDAEAYQRVLAILATEPGSAATGGDAEDLAASAPAVDPHALPEVREPAAP
jgi:transposase